MDPWKFPRKPNHGGQCTFTCIHQFWSEFQENFNPPLVIHGKVCVNFNCDILWPPRTEREAKLCNAPPFRISEILWPPYGLTDLALQTQNIMTLPVIITLQVDITVQGKRKRFGLRQTFWLNLTASLRQTFSKFFRHVWRDRRISRSLTVADTDRGLPGRGPKSLKSM